MGIGDYRQSEHDAHFLPPEPPDVFDELRVERKRQDGLWGTAFDDKNTPNDWVAYITRYVSEGAYDSRNKVYTVDRFREHLVKAACLCVAAIETIDRNGGCAPRHYDRVD